MKMIASDGIGGRGAGPLGKDSDSICAEMAWVVDMPIMVIRLTVGGCAMSSSALD